MRKLQQKSKDTKQLFFHLENLLTFVCLFFFLDANAKNALERTKLKEKYANTEQILVFVKVILT